jgi:hypothetical protein
VTRRVVAIALVVIGVGATLVGAWGRLFLDEDEGHHDGRTPSFARSAVQGADELIVEPVGEGVAAARVERAGQVLVDYDEVHDGVFHVFTVGANLDGYGHEVFEVPSPDGTYPVEPPPSGAARVVVQAAPDGGPDLLELGTDVALPGGAGSDQVIAVGDTWSEGELTVRRQGLDFVLSEPWTSEERFGGPALLALFRAEDLAFVHAHATTVGDDRFSFSVDLPGRGEYLAALEFVQDGDLVTALFRLEI